MIRKDPRRCFTRVQRTILFEDAGGRCCHCFIKISRNDFHADHVIPHSEGGPTEVSNGQALCASCNMIKGADIDPKTVALLASVGIDVDKIRAEIKEREALNNKAVRIELSSGEVFNSNREMSAALGRSPSYVFVLRNRGESYDSIWRRVKDGVRRDKYGKRITLASGLSFRSKREMSIAMGRFPTYVATLSGRGFTYDEIWERRCPQIRTRDPDLVRQHNT